MLKKVLRSGAVVLVLAAALFASYKYYVLKMAYEAEGTANATLAYQGAIFLDKLKAANSMNNELSAEVSDMQTLLQAKTQDNASKEQQVAQLSTTVATLDRLNSTDKELLEKYSDVYFLNENYTPVAPPSARRQRSKRATK
jgi:hypothetical protein